MSDQRPHLPDVYDLILDGRMRLVESRELAGGRAMVCVRRRPGRTSQNEDSVLLAPVDATRAVVVVADGAGGLPDAHEASQRAVRALAEALSAAGDADLRLRIEQGFRRAHHEILALGSGAATTVSLVLIDGDEVWSYHVGDSMTLILGSDGGRKLQTVPHSPVGYAVRDGLLSEEQAIHHDELHLVSNLLGIGRVEVERRGPFALAAGDTLVVGSDGLFDNLLIRDVTRLVCGRPVDVAARELASEVERRMTAPRAEDPSKPDDLSFVLFRREGGSAARSTPGP
jgi:serine/threonine protein phosphatase PrpC